LYKNEKDSALCGLAWTPKSFNLNFYCLLSFTNKLIEISSSFPFFLCGVAGCKKAKYVVEGNFHVGSQLSFVSWISYEKCMMILRMQIIIFYLCLQNIYLCIYVCTNVRTYWRRKFMRPYVASTLKIHVKIFPF